MGAEKPDGPLDRQLQGSPLCQVLGCSTEADFMQPLRDKVTGLVMPGRLFLCSAHYLVLLEMSEAQFLQSLRFTVAVTSEADQGESG